MSSTITFGRTSSGNTVYWKNQKGNLEFITRHQAGQQVYYDRFGHRIGYVDSLGRTMSAESHILNSQTRPDLILAKLRSK
jgi:hypothetical protein